MISSGRLRCPGVLQKRRHEVYEYVRSPDARGERPVFPEACWVGVARRFEAWRDGAVWPIASARDGACSFTRLDSELVEQVSLAVGGLVGEECLFVGVEFREEGEALAHVGADPLDVCS